jgi:hypothetical protein
LTSAFLDPKRSLPTQYGAIVGLSVLGDNVIRVLLLPNLTAYLDLLTPHLFSKESDAITRMEAQMCFGAMLSAVGNYVKHQFQDLPFFIPPELFPAPKVAEKTPKEEEKENEKGAEEPEKKKRRIDLSANEVSLSTEALLDLFDIYGEQLQPFCPPADSELVLYFL